MKDFDQIFLRQINVKDFTKSAQELLASKKVAIIGCGGLGSNVATILHSMGVFHLSLFDFDKVELSNLPRQLPYTIHDLGKDKSSCLKQSLAKKYNINHIQSFNVKIDESNVFDLINNFDLILDCCDNLQTRLLISKASYRYKIPLVYASVVATDGQLMTFDYKDEHSPCLECLMQDNYIFAKSNAQIGVLASSVAIIAAMQTSEAVNYLVNNNNASLNKLIHIDLKNYNMLSLLIKKNDNCRQCSLV